MGFRTWRASEKSERLVTRAPTDQDPATRAESAGNSCDSNPVVTHDPVSPKLAEMAGR
jgi:hypothetical protein